MKKTTATYLIGDQIKAMRKLQKKKQLYIDKTWDTRQGNIWKERRPRTMTAFLYHCILFPDEETIFRAEHPYERYIKSGDLSKKRYMISNRIREYILWLSTYGYIDIIFKYRGGYHVRVNVPLELDANEDMSKLGLKIKAKFDKANPAIEPRIDPAYAAEKLKEKRKRNK
jgi:hypothetical protein